MSVAARATEALDESLAACDENSPRLFVALRLAARPFRPAGRGCDGGALFAFNLRALFGRSLRFFLRLFAPLFVAHVRVRDDEVERLSVAQPVGDATFAP